MSLFLCFCVSFLFSLSNQILAPQCRNHRTSWLGPVGTKQKKEEESVGGALSLCLSLSLIVPYHLSLVPCPLPLSLVPCPCFSIFHHFPSSRFLLPILVVVFRVISFLLAHSPRSLSTDKRLSPWTFFKHQGILIRRETTAQNDFILSTSGRDSSRKPNATHYPVSCPVRPAASDAAKVLLQACSSAVVTFQVPEVWIHQRTREV